jgi:mono/diheme cytochrome c family protein
MRKLFVIVFIIFSGLAGIPQEKKQTKPASSSQTKPKPQAPQQSSLTAAKQRGKIGYETYCLACHQPDGAGIPRMNPPLIKTTYVLGDKKKLIGIVLNGLNAGVEIDGETYSNPMPAQDFLKDQEIADLLTYVRNSFGNKASMVTVNDVKAVRAAKK